jgi:hypothetical protein
VVSKHLNVIKTNKSNFLSVLEEADVGLVQKRFSAEFSLANYYSNLRDFENL